MQPVIKPREKGGIQIRDPYYDKVMSVLETVEKTCPLTSLITVDGESLSEVLGEISVQLTEIVGVAFSVVKVAELLVAKLAGKIYRWTVLNAPTQKLKLETPSPSITTQ